MPISHEPQKHEGQNDEQYIDRSMDHVARVHAAKEAAQREMEAFGDISEYDVTVIQGQLREEPTSSSQPSFSFDAQEKA